MSFPKNRPNPYLLIEQCFHNMGMKKNKSESGSRFLTRLGAASAPAIRPTVQDLQKPKRPQSSKELYSYEYFQIDDHTDPVKIMVPNLMANKQNRLQTGRRCVKRAVTAGFSRSHTVTIAPNDNNRVMAWEQEPPRDGRDKKIVSNVAELAQTTNRQEDNGRFSGISAMRRSSENNAMNDRKNPPRISVNESENGSFYSNSSSTSEHPPTRSNPIAGPRSSRKKSASRMSFFKVSTGNELLLAPLLGSSEDDRQSGTFLSLSIF